MDKYEKLVYIGRGQYGEVYSSLRIGTSQPVAIKKIDKKC